MCGIFGQINFNNREVQKKDLITMSEKMIHRGPDDIGIHLDKNIGIGMRRLSIIDLEGGHQPISNETDDILLVLNGEIYNYKELRLELEELGHVFKTNTDVESIIHLYEEYGLACISKINGMYSFALYDKRKKMIWIARDRLGIKPLYFFQDSDTFIFSSDLLALNKIAHQQVDEYSIMQYVGYSYVPAPNTIYQNIFKVMPAEQILIEGNKVTKSFYWKINEAVNDSLKEEKSSQKIVDILGNSLKIQTRSDVPIGYLLSGGVDSSIVAAFSRKIRPDINISSFTIDYDKKNSDDAKYARIISKSIGSKHNEIKIDSKKQFFELQDLIRKIDEPIADGAAISTFILSKYAKKKGVKVLLSGAGGDEIFGGYSRYFSNTRFSAEWITELPSVIKFPILLPLYFFNKSMFWRLSKTSHNFIYSISGFSYDLILKASKKKALLNKMIDKFESLNETLRTRNVRSKMFEDISNYLPNNILSITDKATMACSIEARVPLLDHNLVDFAFSIPEEINFPNSSPKKLFGNAFKKYIPKEIISRRKDGFGMPIHEWIENWAEDIGKELTFHLVPEIGNLFDMKIINKHLTNNVLRRRSAQTLFSLYVLNFWLRTHKE